MNEQLETKRSIFARKNYRIEGLVFASDVDEFCSIRTAFARNWQELHGKDGRGRFGRDF